ncbi:uncharacterized protein OCT59_015916 [Rhizophagus irregularis]|uniref:Skt5p n=2 Tax=Rhizophagus irregularis TaxID=588596 RepID=A0A015JX91_RHIIW|nr:Skt5p [Rhizophagus irregularis DAOM 197198w]UZO23583.1 hypothetical protein OCT59_015916 [Rhizophagus irregularis]GBC30770.1 kinase-like domain-containing protein [Rhizophagus irregularis DAOM 181602=DAOM 197198]
MSDKQLLNTDIIYSFNINNSLNEFSQIIQNFNKINIKEIKPTIKNSIFDGDLSIIIDEMVNFIFKELNEGIYKEIINKNFINFMNDHEIIPKEIYNYILNDQNNSNSIYLLGYFNYYGIEVNINQQRAFELYQKSMKLKNHVAQLELAEMYIYGIGVNKNHDKAFELTKELADIGIPNAINKIGYCYENGIGTNINKKKTFEFYKEAADLGNSNGINNLAYCHYNGIGTIVDKQKGFELYKKAANLKNDLAQYNLAFMYETGNGIEENIEQAVYWYKKSAEQGYLNAQNKLKMLPKL